MNEKIEALLKSLGIIMEKMEKSENAEVVEMKKSFTGLTEEIKKIGSLSDEDKDKLSKIEDLEKTLKEQTEMLDKLSKTGISLGGEEDMKKYDSDMNTYLKTGIKSDLIAKSLNTSDGSGGALLSDNRAKEIIKEIMETSPVYAAARIYTSSNANLKVRVKVKGVNNAGGQAEGTDVGAASGSTYKFLELKAGKMTDWQEITQEMKDDAEYNVMNEVKEDSAENLAELTANAIWNGTMGVANMEYEGIYKNTEVTTNALTGTLTWENMVDLAYKLPKKTRARGTYYVSTSALNEMRKWKDTTGAPLYTAPLTAGEPGIFNGYKVIEDSYMDDVAEGKYPVFFGDMKAFYAILRRKGIYMEPKREAETDTHKIFTRLREGGRVRQASQGKLLKMVGLG